MPIKNYDVAIIGCGPVGATLVNYLVLYGHTVAVIEKHAEVFYCPRAGGVDDETRRNFDTIGVLDEIIQNGDIYEADLVLCDADERPISVLNRASLGEEHTSGHANLPVFSMFYQPNVEKTLRRAYEDSPLVDSYTGYEVIAIEEHDQSATIKYFKRGDKSEGEIEAKYIVGCDGANSFVAKQLKVDETNFDYTEKYLIIDAYVNDDIYFKTRFPEGAKMIFDPVYAGVVGKGMHNHIRLDFRMHEDSVIGANLNTQEEFQEAAEKLIAHRDFDLKKLDIVRLVEYKFEARTPEKWRVGRLLIAGDAAHLTPPWAGQGLNMGIRDVANIAFKLNMVLAGRAGESLLETYTQERRPSTLKTIEGAVKTGQLMETTNPLVVGLRTFALRLIGMSEAVARAMAKQWQNKPPYKEGLIGQSSVLAGTWMIQPKVGDKTGKIMLMDRLIGPNFALISTDSSMGKNVYRFVDELGGRVLKLDVDFSDHTGKFRAWCKENKVKTVLMRPDRYIFDAGHDGDELCASLFEEIDRYGDTEIKQKQPRSKNMRGSKIYNGINGLLYSVYGILGVFKPGIVFGANALQASGVHGTHSIRALWGAICVMGLIIFWKGLKPATARATTLVVTLVSVGLVLSRLLGYALDGTDGMLSDQRGPLLIEGVMAIVGGLIYWRSSSR